MHLNINLTFANIYLLMNIKSKYQKPVVEQSCKGCVCGGGGGGGGGEGSGGGCLEACNLPGQCSKLGLYFPN